MSDVEETPEEQQSFERSPMLQRTRSRTISQLPVTEKEYTAHYIDGFKIKLQGELTRNAALLQALTEDLEAVLNVYLPQHALRTLQDIDVKIWVHQDGDYSFNDETFVSSCNFFQCGKDVVNTTRNIKMNGHVELICEDYLLHREKWGVGGLLLHEFAHAYEFHCLSSEHTRQLKTVFENNRALYEERNPNAVTNVGEFFAELSVAYLAKDVSLNHLFPKQRADIDAESLAVIADIWESHRRDSF